MDLISSAKGHDVFVRCPTSPPSWEAACSCGFRSPRVAKELAEAAAKDHAANPGPPVERRASKLAKVKPAPKRGTIKLAKKITRRGK